MANKEISPDSLARQMFIVTLLGVILYVTVVFTFIIGGNRREEAAAAKAQAGQHD
ncbi:MAG TPA: hypothetical protein VF331_23240 [Polyangiales bacterium]|jgi:hypothetical protein